MVEISSVSNASNISSTLRISSTNRSISISIYNTDSKKSISISTINNDSKGSISNMKTFVLVRQTKNVPVIRFQKIKIVKK